MIRNGRYAVTSKLLDGVEGGAIGSYTCSGGKWKGELTTREDEPGLITTLFA
jgi:hypothetical protein